MIISNQHPRTKAERYMSIPISKREYDRFMRGQHLGDINLTEDQISIIRTGLLRREDETMKRRNFDKKYMDRVTTPKTHRDRKKDSKRGYVKHKQKDTKDDI